MLPGLWSIQKAPSPAAPHSCRPDPVTAVPAVTLHAEQLAAHGQSASRPCVGPAACWSRRMTTSDPGRRRLRAAQASSERPRQKIAIGGERRITGIAPLAGVAQGKDGSDALQGGAEPGGGEGGRTGGWEPEQGLVPFHPSTGVSGQAACATLRRQRSNAEEKIRGYHRYTRDFFGR